MKAGNQQAAVGGVRPGRPTKSRSAAATKSGAAKASAQTRSGAGAARNGSSSEASMPVKMAKSALAGLVGSVAIGIAQRAASERAASRRSRRTRVLGIGIPNGFKARNLGTDVKKLSASVDYRDLLKRIGDTAEIIETHSDEIRMLSSQAKRLSRKLS